MFSDKVVQKFKKLRTIFIFDYVFSIVISLIFLYTQNFVLCIVLLTLYSIPQATTGLVYEPIALKSYSEDFIGRLGTIISLFLSMTSILFVVLSMIFSNMIDINIILMLNILFGVIAIIVMIIIKSDNVKIT